MRATAWIVLAGLMGAAIAAVPAQATVNMSPTAKVAPAPNIVQVDRRCGEDRRWVPRHRNREGKWVRGHCAANRRR